MEMKNTWKKILYVGKKTWINGFDNKVQDCVYTKRQPMNEKCVDANVCEMVKMRGSCLPVMGSTRLSWKYDDEHVCVVIYIA